MWGVRVWARVVVDFGDWNGNWFGFLGNCGYRAKGITSVEPVFSPLFVGIFGARGLYCLQTLLRRKFAKSIVWKLYKMAFRTLNQREEKSRQVAMSLTKD